MDVEAELAKLRYHVQMLANTIDFRENPIEHLVVAMNWSEQDLDDALDLFEKYDLAFTTSGALQGGLLERELKERFEITYQTVKDIVLAFWRNGNFPDVCVEYARQHRVAEFDEMFSPSVFRADEDEEEP